MSDATRTPLSDGGWVTSYVEDLPEGLDRLHVQKFTANGSAIGTEFVTSIQSNVPAEVVGLSNGGYVAVSGWALRGYYYTGYVFDPAATKLTEIDLPGYGEGYEIASSSKGGFLVQSRDVIASGPINYFGNPLITLYDNTGGVALPTVRFTGGTFDVGTTAAGDYTLSWADGNLNHAFTLDPTAPPDLSAPPPPVILGLLDDASGSSTLGQDRVDDTTPTVRVAVNETGFINLSLNQQSGSTDGLVLGGVTVTAQDVARGYIDIEIQGVPGPATLYAYLKSDYGVLGAPATQSVTITGAPQILSANDDVGPAAGLIASGATTDDATPTLRLNLADSWARAGLSVQVLDGNEVVARSTLTAADLSLGYIDVTTSALTEGSHELHTLIEPYFPSVGSYTVVVDTSPDSASGEVLTSAGPGSSLSGGTGADTLIASQGLDTLAGGAGADVFRLSSEPWAPIHITDFAPDQDKLDLSALFQASGYNGADPVADGYVYLESNGAGGTIVRFDRDAAGGNPQWPNTIVDLENVSPAGLTWEDLASGGGAPADGVAFASSSPGTSLSGGAGADTLIASAGLDTLTGGAGADVFRLPTEPWAPIHITDFMPEQDKLDLTALLQASGYTGADPIADGYIYLESDGAGGTVVRFDRDAAGGTPQWPNTIIDLENVSPVGLTWDDLTGGGGAETGQTLTSSGPGAALAGGDGADTLIASQGLDTLSGGAGADVFALPTEPWAPIHITDFAAGEDKLDLSALFAKAGYGGADPIADRYIYIESDGAGGSVLRFDRDADGPTPEWPNTIVNLHGVAPGQVSASDWIAA